MKRFMLVVVAALAFGSLAAGRYQQSIRRARQATYKEDLHIIQQAINQYMLDKHPPPKSLQDLVEAHYLLAIPNVSFIPEMDGAPVLGDPVLRPNLTAFGLTDANSNSAQVSGKSNKDHPASHLAKSR